MHIAANVFANAVNDRMMVRRAAVIFALSLKQLNDACSRRFSHPSNPSAAPERH
jgi:hypothetical protein